MLNDSEFQKDELRREIIEYQALHNKKDKKEETQIQ
jgi:hypothetical protein